MADGLVRIVKGKPRNFEANLCGSLHSTFKTSFLPHALYHKRLQTLFNDQLDRSGNEFLYIMDVLYAFFLKSQFFFILPNFQVANFVENISVGNENK